MYKKTLEKPLLRSFGKRQGRKIGPTKERYLQTISPYFLLHDSWGTPNPLHKEDTKTLQQIWQVPKQENRKKILEIGFGSGEHLRHRLCEDRTCLFLASEVYRNGIASCISRIVQGGLVDEFRERLRIYPDDFRLLLPAIADDTFDEVSILFPDPWPKKRHEKRRLLQPHFLDEIARILKPEGELRIASDHVELMVWMIEQMMAHQQYACSDNLLQEGMPVSHLQEFPQGWHMTRYQQKALREGRTSYFLSVKTRKAWCSHELAVPISTRRSKGLPP